MPFADSRRLTGSNLFFDSAGAVLEAVGSVADDAVLAGWHTRVLRARSWLHWPDSQRRRSIAIRRHSAGVSLALAASRDQLFTATEVNEWALCATLIDADPVRWSQLESALIEAGRQATPPAPVFAQALPVLDENAAFARFTALSKAEASPRLRSLIEAAKGRGLQLLLDDDQLTLGSGAGGITWSIDELPSVEQVPWSQLSDVPCAIVTGSNGKTTTVRLLAACVRAHGRRDGYNCTDGVFVGGESKASGDYSGPAGTRAVLRDTRVETAILETARGGILRRGLAAEHADVAVVTNVSADHFGEYGIDDLAGLADVKLVVASTLGQSGVLLLNADDPILSERGRRFEGTIGWFSLQYDHAVLVTHRASGGLTSGVRNGRLIANDFDLGAIAEMPLTVDGSADYNVSNIAGAALAALALSIPPATIAGVLARFGGDPADNPGRLMRYHYRGAIVLIDYAHNPEGLSGLMSVAVHLRRTGRLALLLGQAGNRATADIERLAVTAARFQPDFVVIKEIEAYLRGRAPGEVPAIIRAALLRAGLPESAHPRSVAAGGSSVRPGWGRSPAGPAAPGSRTC